MTSRHTDSRDRGADLLSAPRPGDLHPLPALRPADLPGLHARRRRRLPVPELHRGGRQVHPQRARRRTAGCRSANPAATSIALVGINVGVWLIIIATGGGTATSSSGWRCCPRAVHVRVEPRRALPDGASEQVCNTVPNGDGLWFPGVSDGAYWQLITNAFTHVEVWHIGFNMLALWVLGPQLELAIGRARFLALYIMSALAGSALVYWAGGDHHRHPRRLRRGVRADGRAAGPGAQGRRQRAADPDVDRHQLPDHRGVAAARSPGRGTWAGSSAAY